MLNFHLKAALLTLDRPITLCSVYSSLLDLHPPVVRANTSQHVIIFLVDPKAGQFGRFIDGGYISVILSNSSASDDLNNEGLVIPSSTLELVNFVFGLLAYSAHMCSVFWQCSQQFALIFALQLLLAVALHVISYMGFTELYTLLFLDESSPASLALSPTLLTILYLLSSAILFASSWTVCQFGYGICLERIGGYLRRIGHTSPLSGLSGSCTAYMPHSIALVTIIVYVGCNGPIMYDSVSMYQQTGSRLLMTHLTACVVYMLVWITMWFTFTVKQDWEFSIQELALKRHAILLNRQQLFITPDNEFTEEPPSSNSSVANEPTTPTQSRVDVGEDNLSNSTTSTNNNDSHRAGILSQRQVKHKRRGNEQKVKFQEATKILIETDLDADLDTIAESDNEHADSALFSGSSNDSNESNHNLTHTVINEQPNISKAGHTPRYTINSTLAPTKSLILSPNHLNSLSAVTRLYKSTGDITNSTPRGDTPQQQSNYIYNGHPVSTTATRHDNTQRPYTIHHSIGRTNSNNKSTFIDNAISSAV